VQNVIGACTRVLTRNITQYSGHKVTLRPLDGKDVQGLREFFESLSHGTRLAWKRDLSAIKIQSMVNSIAPIHERRRIAGIVTLSV
jgi:hypothetical protein